MQAGLSRDLFSIVQLLADIPTWKKLIAVAKINSAASRTAVLRFRVLIITKIHPNYVQFFNSMPTHNLRMNGKFVEIYFGKLSRFTTYKNNSRHGYDVQYHLNGVPSSITPYRNNKWHGTRRAYTDGGRLAFYEQYDDGLLHGLREYYIYSRGYKVVSKWVFGGCVSNREHAISD